MDNLIEHLLADVEEDRQRLDRREQTLRVMLDSLGANAATASEEGPGGLAVIVAARLAYGFFLRHGAYVCQAYRAFNAPGITHLGFYAEGKIQREIPEIVARRQNVEWTFENAERLRSSGDDVEQRVADVIEASLRTRERVEGDRHDIYLLTSVDDGERTFLLPHPIVHQTWRHNGSAWTRKHRYVPIDALATFPTTTDELEAAQHDVKVRRYAAAGGQVGH